MSATTGLLIGCFVIAMVALGHSFRVEHTSFGRVVIGMMFLAALGMAILCIMRPQ